MVKSLRHDQKNYDNFSFAARAGRVRIAGHTDFYLDSDGNTTPDGDAAPHGNGHARVDLSA